MDPVSRVRYPGSMTSLADFPDPLVSQLHTSDGAADSPYEWRFSKAFQAGRDAFLKGKAEPFDALLDHNEWQKGTEKQPAGTSLMAWRGWWSCVRWDTDWADIEAMLARVPAFPPADDDLHWFAAPNSRWAALDRLFSSARAPRADAPDDARDSYAAAEDVRRAVVERLTDRWPALTSLYLQSVQAPAFKRQENESRVEFFFHPLLTTARPGREQEFLRLLAIDGLEPVLPQPVVAEEDEAPLSSLRSRVLPPGAEPTLLLALGLERGFEPLVQAALTAGAAWNGTFEEYKNRLTLLHRLAGRQRLDAVERAIAEGADLEALDSYGRTPFLAAARLSDVALMRTLVEHGANIHARDRFGQTAAHLAVEGLKVADYDWSRASPTNPVYKARDPRAVQEGVERLGLALGELRRMGVEVDAECLGPPKNSKKSPSPFAGFPTKRRSPSTAVAGQTWEAQIRGRVEREEFMPPTVHNLLRALLLEDHLSRIIPPELDDVPVRSRPRF